MRKRVVKKYQTGSSFLSKLPNSYLFDMGKDKNGNANDYHEHHDHEPDMFTFLSRIDRPRFQSNRDGMERRVPLHSVSTKEL